MIISLSSPLSWSTVSVPSCLQQFRVSILCLSIYLSIYLSVCLLLLLFIVFIWRCSLLSSRLTAHMSHVILNEWLYPFIARIINIHGSGVLVALCECYMAGATWNAAVSAQVLCTPFNHAPCHFIQSHTGRVYVCLAVTCHLHFWQNDQDLLRATVVTRGWNGYGNKSQHRKLTMKKEILPSLLPGL